MCSDNNFSGVKVKFWTTGLKLSVWSYDYWGCFCHWTDHEGHTTTCKICQKVYISHCNTLVWHIWLRLSDNSTQTAAQAAIAALTSAGGVVTNVQDVASAANIVGQSIVVAQDLLNLINSWVQDLCILFIPLNVDLLKITGRILLSFRHLIAHS